MSDYLRYLVTVDAASGELVKVEQFGEAGDLTPLDLPAFVRSLAAAGASPQPQPQVVINIFGGTAADTLAADSTPQPGPPPAPRTNICFPPPITPPQGKLSGKRGRK